MRLAVPQTTPEVPQVSCQCETGSADAILRSGSIWPKRWLLWGWVWARKPASIPAPNQNDVREPESHVTCPKPISFSR